MNLLKNRSSYFKNTIGENKMKKMLIVMMMLIYTGCATTGQLANHENITQAVVMEKCTVDQQWMMQVMGYPVMIANFKNCLGVNTMLVMVSSSETYTENIRRETIKLLELHYLEYLNGQDETKRWSLEKIKEQVETGNLFIFYSITSKDVEASD
jgi:signal recognition particle receptor subunit beta